MTPAGPQDTNITDAIPVARTRRPPQPEPLDRVTDADLAARYAGDRDPAALAELVKRYGPVVFATCRRCLGDPNLADDAFQATFLVLVRKPRAALRARHLGPWLHRIAWRVSVRLRAKRAARPHVALNPDAMSTVEGEFDPDLAR